MNELLNYFQNRQPEIVKLIHEIVETESPSYDVAGSKKAVDWFVNQGSFHVLPFPRPEETFGAEDEYLSKITANI